jgi:hypothetical protein
MNYRSLRKDELERMAYVGDEEARTVLLEMNLEVGDSVARESALRERRNIGIRFGAALAAVVKGKGSKRDIEKLRGLLEEIGQ